AAREAIEKNPRLAGFLAYLKREGDRFRREEIPPLPYSRFILFDALGDRKQFEGPYFERRDRLLVYGLSSWLWEKPEDISGLQDIIWAICDEYSWCLPAHMGGKSRSPAVEAAASLGIITEPRFDNGLTIDLFACETGLALAECCAALEGLLAPAVLDRARKEVYRRLIKSYLEYGAFQHWELLKMNWCSVCGGGLGAAACYLVKDDAMLGGILHKLLPTVDRFLESFASDGACVEGLSYWNYGVSYFVIFADILFHRTGGRIDLLKDPRFERIAAFQQKCYLPGGARVCFSDTENTGFRLGITGFLCRRIPGVAAPPSDRAMKMEADEGGHFNRALRDFPQALRDLLWTEDRDPPPFRAEPLVILPEAQWLIASAGEIAFAAKGGHNGEPHNHNDVGSFIYYKKGKMVICDLGSGEYTKDYFNENRYTVFCNQSLSHSVPVINGEAQKPGREDGAKDCRMGPGAEMGLDIAGAYGTAGLLSLKRHFVFDPAGGGLKLEDRFLFSADPLPVTERFVSLYPPRLEKHGPWAVFIDTGASQGILKCSLPAVPLVREQKHRDHYGYEITVYLIDFSFLPADPEFSVDFEIV
ncbi:MAG: heparinase II/III-family protein, partial [Treponema sp.]|nr:heparinase II/III-family protein [Treponema sp.]